MQTSKQQPFPPDFVYLLHAAARHSLPDQSAHIGGGEDDDERNDQDDELPDDDDD